MSSEDPRHSRRVVVTEKVVTSSDSKPLDSDVTGKREEGGGEERFPFGPLVGEGVVKDGVGMEGSGGQGERRTSHVSDRCLLSQGSDVGTIGRTVGPQPTRLWDSGLTVFLGLRLHLRPSNPDTHSGTPQSGHLNPSPSGSAPRPPDVVTPN